MQLNEIRAAPGSRRARKRRGRGPGTGWGKTGGRGHKGQKSRSGGNVRRGFEGGQMPLQRRLPKYGFASRKALVREEIRVSAVNRIQEATVTLELLCRMGIVAKNTKYAKLFGVARIDRAYTVRGLEVSRGARAAIEASGGKIED